MYNALYTHIILAMDIRYAL